MGLGSSKRVPLATVSAKMLSKLGAKPGRMVMSPALCASILNADKRGVCNEEDLKAVKDFLAGPKNSKHGRARSMKLDVELLKCLSAPTQLSLGAERHLRSILIHFDFVGPEIPHLMSTVVVPRLENVLLEHRALVRRERREHAWSLTRKFFHRLLYFFRHKIRASDLRAQPKGVETLPGLDRAHKLSLHLAVGLWKLVHGHDYITAGDRKMLKSALAKSSNVYYTCTHTNRVLHVRYDNEISDALLAAAKGNGSAKLSPGAKARVRQVRTSLLRIGHDSRAMSRFSTKANKLLASVL